MDDNSSFIVVNVFTYISFIALFSISRYLDNNQITSIAAETFTGLQQLYQMYVFILKALHFQKKCSVINNPPVTE